MQNRCVSAMKWPTGCAGSAATSFTNRTAGSAHFFCIYEARDPKSIREHARRVGMPGEEFYRVATTVVVRTDPVEPKAAE